MRARAAAMVAVVSLLAARALAQPATAGPPSRTPGRELSAPPAAPPMTATSGEATPGALRIPLEVLASTATYAASILAGVALGAVLCGREEDTREGGADDTLGRGLAESMCVMMFVSLAAAPGAFVLAPMAAWGTGNALGGDGGLGWTVLATIAAHAIGGLVAGVPQVLRRDGVHPAAVSAAILGVAIALVGPAIGYELTSRDAPAPDARSIAEEARPRYW